MAALVTGHSKARLPEDAGSHMAEENRLALDRDPRIRAELARRQDLRPELLFYLAVDPDAVVRRAVARNRNTPAQADMLLAKDGDDSVRSDLAKKVVQLTPGFSSGAQRQAQRHVVRTLEILAADQAVRIRQILAETLKDVADAPPQVIQRLARDAELPVACPVLELSPLLSDHDLLEIIESGEGGGKLSAISRRRDVGSGVADAIVATNDVAAIAALLDNPSAQLREETLDSLVDRANDVADWHGPLVRRPQLPPGAAGRLAAFVADSLLAQLRERRDLEPDQLQRVEDELHRRLAVAHESESVRSEATGEGAVDEETLLHALAIGNRAQVKAGLARASGFGPDVVERILEARSAKAITALAWKAGFSMRFATQLQLRIGGIAPREAISAPGRAGFPLSAEEMEWQLEFYATLP